MASPLKPRLFPEIIDCIIDHAHDDKSTLASVALVSRTCVPVSRYHLFSAIHLSPRTHKRIPRLMESILSPLSSISGVANVLTISMARGQGDNKGNWLRTPLLMDALGRLTALRVLQTSEIDFSVTRGAELLQTFSGSGVTQLMVYKTKLRSAPQLASFLDSLPHLSALQVTGATFEFGAPADYFHPSIQSLSLGPYDLALFATSPNPVSLPRLTQFRLASVPGTCIQALSNILKEMGPSLHQLTIGFCLCSPSTFPAEPEPLSLSHNTSLQEVNFENICFRGDSGRQPHLTKLLLDALSRVTSPILKTINLTFLLDSVGAVPPSFLEDLDLQLSGAKYPQLENVFLRINDISEDHAAFLRNHCTTLDHAGVLKIPCGSSVV